MKSNCTIGVRITLFGKYILLWSRVLTVLFNKVGFGAPEQLTFSIYFSEVQTDPQFIVFGM